MRTLLDRHWRLILGTAWLCAVALLTLQATRRRVDMVLVETCLICGDRGTADAILNIALFVPLGLVLGAKRHAMIVALAVGLGLSTAIESVQMMLPGRHSGISDILCNAFGAAVGVLLYRLLQRHFSGHPGRAGPLLAMWTSVSFVLAGALVTPHPPDTDLSVQWAVTVGAMRRYRGRVLDARLNGRQLHSRLNDEPPLHGTRLDSPWSLTGTVVVGEPRRGVSPILSLLDDDREEVLLLGAHGDDLVFRERTIARQLRLDSPDLRVPAAFSGLAAGDTTEMLASRDQRLCLRVDQVERCGLGVTPGRSWGLLLYLDSPSERTRAWLDFFWLTMLFAPLGLLARSRFQAVTFGAVGVTGMLASVAFTSFVFGPWLEIFACALGVGLGRFGALVVPWVAGGGHGEDSPAIPTNV